MLDLYITRHGQTVWNTEHRFQGRKDSPLTELGKEQARLLHNRIKDIKFDVIYTSPSARAMETSMLIKGDLDIPLIQSERLYEMNFGDWEGEILENILERYAEQYRNLILAPSKYVPITGETYEQVFERTFDFIEELKQKEKQKTVLIVTHGITRKAIMSFFQKEEIDTFWSNERIAKQTSLTRVKIEENGDYEVLMNNDYSHWKHLDEE